MEAVQHLSNLDDVGRERRVFRLSDQLQIGCSLNLVLDFRRRSPGNRDVVSEIPIRGSSASFGQRLRNGLGRSTKLVGESQVVTRDSFYDGIEPQQNSARFLPYKKVAK